MILEIHLNAANHSDQAYEEMNALFEDNALLYNTLKMKLQKSGISEESLMEWSRFVKLASAENSSIYELEEFAVIKILRSWKSIAGMILLSQPKG